MVKTNKYLNLIVIMVMTIFLVSSYLLHQNVYAHQRQLFTIGNTDYLFVVGSLNEPIFLDDKTGVDFAAYSPDPNDPVDSKANGTKPIEGLENILKVELAAGDKKKVLNFEPAYQNPGRYEAVFFPTIETTYNYTLFGNINGTDFRATWTCSPVEGEPLSDNSTVQISDDVIRKAMLGSFGCPQPRTDLGFPEPYLTNNEIVNKLNELETK
ncbi:MAG: hypothetical protein ACRD8K_08295 [Nitrososphaeraceae archaeon]